MLLLLLWHNRQYLKKSHRRAQCEARSEAVLGSSHTQEARDDT